MKRPSVSVIMSVYNGERFMAAAIESILNQTFTDFEFLITDDGSTDATPSILDEYARKDARVKVIRQKNTGLTETLNRMVKIAQGEFVARMDADDLSLPERLKKQIDKMREKPDYLVIGSWFRTVCEEAENDYEMFFPDNPETLKTFIHRGVNCYAHGSVLIRKRLFEDLGLMYRFRYGQDFDLWLRASETGSIGMVEEVLYHRIDHRSSISRSLVPQRAALMNVMLRLSDQRLKNGRETDNWRTQEEKVFKEISRWNEKEIESHDVFLNARSLLCRGEGRKARELLISIQKDFGRNSRFLAPYLLTYLPGFFVGPILRQRDILNDRKWFKRRIKG